MGKTDGKKPSSSAKLKTVTIAGTNGCPDSPIPQMVITSAEGESEELKLDNDTEGLGKGNDQIAHQDSQMGSSTEACLVKEEITQDNIYEVIEPKKSSAQENGLEDTPKSASEKEVQSTHENFFTKSKNFWKHDGKPLFTFPKFTFGSKESKKTEKVVSQEYSLEAAESAQEPPPVEQYRKIDTDVQEVTPVPSTAEPKVPTVVKQDSFKSIDRSSMIHPVTPKSVSLPPVHRAEEECFDIHEEPQQPPGQKRAGTPESLYGACCIKLSHLIRHKAIGMVTIDGGKVLPPKKPPKPSAEAVAKARSDIAAKRLQEYESRPHHFGEDLPTGFYNGIRYADEDTESSNDYKDVDNYGVVLNPECYGIIRKMKAENEEDCRAPSTCSGMSSYYTADTITLKDGNSSDNTLETVSLGSHDSIVCRPEPKPNNESVKPPDSTCKKVPPPVPPKPSPSALLKSLKYQSPSSKQMSRYVDSLSLSPRPVVRSSVVSEAAVKKRPLTIAGVKTTEFDYLSMKDKQETPAKVPVLTTIVKNNSLKKMRNLPVEPKCMVKSLSFTRQTTPKPVVPPLPPPQVEPKPIITSPKPPPPPRPPPPTYKENVCKPQIEPKCIQENVPVQSQMPTATPESPQQPTKPSTAPPKSSTTPSSRPARPPPPSPEVKYAVEQVSSPETNNNVADVLSVVAEINQISMVQTAPEMEPDSPLVVVPPARRIKPPHAPPRTHRKRSRTVEVVKAVKEAPEVRRRSQSLSDIEIDRDTTMLSPKDVDIKALYTTVNKDSVRTKAVSESCENDVDKLSISSEVMSFRPLPAPPRPPRSKSHSTSRRSKSDERPSNTMSALEDDNILSKCESLPTEINSHDVRPPTRKKKTDKQRFLSLQRFGRSEDKEDFQQVRFSSLKTPKESPTRPNRKQKHHQQVEFDENANIANPVIESITDNGKKDTPPPLPSRQRVQSMGYEKPKSPLPRRPRSESERTHSLWYDHETETSKHNVSADDSWEKLNWTPNEDASPTLPSVKKPLRTKTLRSSSKFYVNVDDGCQVDLPISSVSCETPSREDKETSPLLLECSEKSVQTSLETLSVGRESRAEQSEDTDDLLDLAQTLQDELKTIITRHKSGDALRSSEESSEGSQHIKPSSVVTVKPRPPLESTTSSASELWQISSSDESDDSHALDHAANLSATFRTKKERKILYISKEIMSSEETFVEALKLLNVEFRMYVETVNKQKGTAIVPDEVLNQILNHLPQLQHLNENLLSELQYRVEQWDSIHKIADVIVKMGPFLKLYSWYIQDFEATTSLLEESKKKYPLFGQAIKDFESSPRCKRLTLNHYMLKPVQRIPQYRLLLQEYLHHLSQDSEDYQDTVEALRIVSDVANHANESMRHGDNFQKLMSIQSSIIGHKEIIKPGRVFMKEGELMKLSRKGMQPRWFVLLNDLLLYLTPVQQGLYRVNHELTLAGMKVAIPLQQDYQNEFSIISVTRSFTLNAKSPEERQEWIVALTKAIEENATKRSTFTAVRLQQRPEQPSGDSQEESFILGRTAPVWIPDARVTMCQLCTSEFTVTFRRHHCRACGKVVCSICSANRISLSYLGNRIARVCDECYPKLGQGSSSGYTESGETDSDNQQIAVKQHLRTDHRHKKLKRQLPSVLKEVSANDVGSTISGYIYKRSNNSWKKSWFVIKEKVLYEFRASEDVAALRSIPLLGYQINTFSEPPFEGVDPSLVFEIHHPGQAPIIFHTETLSAAERWIKELKDATVLE